MGACVVHYEVSVHLFQTTQSLLAPTDLVQQGHSRVLAPPRCWGRPPRLQSTARTSTTSPASRCTSAARTEISPPANQTVTEHPRRQCRNQPTGDRTFGEGAIPTVSKCISSWQIALLGHRVALAMHTRDKAVAFLLFFSIFSSSSRRCCVNIVISWLRML